MANPQLVEVEVARGRTVYAGSRHKPVSAGGKIKIDADEAAWLRRQGFLIDPKAELIPIGDGPNFGTKEGPTIKGVA
jgi:hypothetical protein